jgi:hypothetical protein
LGSLGCWDCWVSLRSATIYCSWLVSFCGLFWFDYIAQALNGVERDVAYFTITSQVQQGCSEKFRGGKLLIIDCKLLLLGLMPALTSNGKMWLLCSYKKSSSAVPPRLLQ